MHIRQATSADLPGVWRIIEQCRDRLLAAGILQWVERYPTFEVVETDAAKGSLYVLPDDPGILAAVTLSERMDPNWEGLDWSLPFGSPALSVHRLAVSPDRQGRGVGRRMMAFAESWAARRGLLSVRLDAYSGHERVLRFYDRLGYGHVGEVHFPGREMAFCCLEKLLRPETRR